VHVRHYHADNRIFASQGFWEEVRQAGQTLTFCGVGVLENPRVLTFTTDKIDNQKDK
jgi:hypothetical protein